MWWSLYTSWLGVWRLARLHGRSWWGDTCCRRKGYIYSWNSKHLGKWYLNLTTEAYLSQVLVLWSIHNFIHQTYFQKFLKFQKILPTDRLIDRQTNLSIGDANVKCKESYSFRWCLTNLVVYNVLELFFQRPFYVLSRLPCRLDLRATVLKTSLDLGSAMCALMNLWIYLNIDRLNFFVFKSKDKRLFLSRSARHQSNPLETFMYACYYLNIHLTKNWPKK